MIETFVGWLFAVLLTLLAPHPAAVHAAPRHHPQPQPPAVAAPAPAAPSTAAAPTSTTPPPPVPAIESCPDHPQMSDDPAYASCPRATPT